MSEYKSFISYSWSSPEHIDWVTQLATDLQNSGVEVIFDRWDLNPGDETNAFMERMVTDEGIKKVIIVSDKEYTDKSNKRKSGAGTEAQMISKEIFSKMDEDKFVVLALDYDSEGNAYIPAYYSSRVYIDFSNDGLYLEKLEELVRWIAKKPKNIKPALGSLPDYITEGEISNILSTGTAFTRAKDAIINDRPHSFSATKNFLELTTTELENFRMEPNFDYQSDAFAKNILLFIPYRNQIIELFRAISNNPNETRFTEIIHAFFERVLNYFSHPANVFQYRELDIDNFRFIGYELFLCALTIFIDEKRYDIFNHLVDNQFYKEISANAGGNSMGGSEEFNEHLEILDYQNNLLNPKRASPVADLLKSRIAGTSFSFQKLMQTDFILFLRSCTQSKSIYERWWPKTACFMVHGHVTFEIFERASSESYFNKIKGLIGVKDKAELANLVSILNSDPEQLPRGGYSKIAPDLLLNFQQLCATK